MTLRPALVLVGPTASGKTGAAHLLCRHLGGFVLSADAMMVYRDMDIGTAKPSPAEQETFGYQGINLTTPDLSFSVHDYVRTLDAVPEPARALVVGGTGLYVRGLVQGLDEPGGVDDAWRAGANAVLEQQGFDALKEVCRARNPDVETILAPGDLANPRRWIRAAERTVPSARNPADRWPHAVRVFGIRRSREDLEQRIRSRINTMLDCGWMSEIERLMERYKTISFTAAQAIGYQEIDDVMAGNATLEVAIERIVIRTRQYAKRQMTWFTHQLPVQWIEATPDTGPEEIAEQIAGDLDG